MQEESKSVSSATTAPHAAAAPIEPFDWEKYKKDSRGYLNVLPALKIRNPRVLITHLISVTRPYARANGYKGSSNALNKLMEADRVLSGTTTWENEHPCVYAFICADQAADEAAKELPKFLGVVSKSSALPSMLRGEVVDWYNNTSLYADLENKARQVEEQQKQMAKLVGELATAQSQLKEKDSQLDETKRELDSARADNEDRLSIASAATTASLANLRASRRSILDPNSNLVKDSQLRAADGKKPPLAKPAEYCCSIIEKLNLNSSEGQAKLLNIMAAYETIRPYISAETGRVCMPADIHPGKQELVRAQLTVLKCEFDELVENEAIEYHRAKRQNPNHVVSESSTINFSVCGFYKTGGYLFETSDRAVYDKYRNWWKKPVETNELRGKILNPPEAKATAPAVHTLSDLVSLNLTTTSFANTGRGSRTPSRSGSIVSATGAVKKPANAPPPGLMLPALPTAPPPSAPPALPTTPLPGSMPPPPPRLAGSTPSASGSVGPGMFSSSRPSTPSRSRTPSVTSDTPAVAYEG